MEIELPKHLWHGNELFTIDLPDAWDVQFCPMNGYAKPPLTAAAMRAALDAPIESPSLRELAKGKQSAVIIFDDMTRPTRTFELAPLVVAELLAGGMQEEDIVFVCALGTHGALSMIDFRKKLGADIVKRFRVFNHNIYENCVEIGTTSRGTKMMINREVANAELKIGIGCVAPHIQAGFSGGGKLVLPGIAHIDSIAHYHNEVEGMGKETTGMGRMCHNIMRKEIDEAAAMAGIDFFINVLVNGRGLTTDIFAGDMQASHRQAVTQSTEHYAVASVPTGKDVTIANAFVKANEMGIAVLMGMLPLADCTGTVVVIADSPEGQVIHYLLGRFGRNYGGRQFPVAAVPENIDLIIMAPHLDKTFGDWFANPQAITWTETWDETRELLEIKFGPGTRAAVIPDATLQYYQ
jgi:nickel-dependent lactate racemase